MFSCASYGSGRARVNAVHRPTLAAREHLLGPDRFRPSCHPRRARFRLVASTAWAMTSPASSGTTRQGGSGPEDEAAGNRPAVGGRRPARLRRPARPPAAPSLPGPASPARSEREAPGRRHARTGARARAHSGVGVGGAGPDRVLFGPWPGGRRPGRQRRGGRSSSSQDHGGSTPGGDGSHGSAPHSGSSNDTSGDSHGSGTSAGGSGGSSQPTSTAPPVCPSAARGARGHESVTARSIREPLPSGDGPTGATRPGGALVRTGSGSGLLQQARRYAYRTSDPRRP